MQTVAGAETKSNGAHAVTVVAQKFSTVLPSTLPQGAARHFGRLVAPIDDSPLLAQGTKHPSQKGVLVNNSVHLLSPTDAGFVVCPYCRRAVDTVAVLPSDGGSAAAVLQRHLDACAVMDGANPFEPGLVPLADCLPPLALDARQDVARSVGITFSASSRFIRRSRAMRSLIEPASSLKELASELATASARPDADARKRKLDELLVSANADLDTAAADAAATVKRARTLIAEAHPRSLAARNHFAQPQPVNIPPFPAPPADGVIAI